MLIRLIVGLGVIAFPVAQAQKMSDSDKDLLIMRLKDNIELYKEQRVILNGELARSKRNEAAARAEVKDLSTRLQAIGMYEGAADERLLQAVADSRVLNKDLMELRQAGSEAVLEVRNFVKFAKIDDPQLRQKVEVAILKLEKLLLGDPLKKRQADKLGTLQKAKVISIDARSGMLVLNVGEKAKAKVGMTFNVTRADRELGEVVIVEVRKSISGALVVSKKNKGVVFRVGDKATLKLQQGTP